MNLLDCILTRVEKNDMQHVTPTNLGPMAGVGPVLRHCPLKDPNWYKSTNQHHCCFRIYSPILEKKGIVRKTLTCLRSGTLKQRLPNPPLIKVGDFATPIVEMIQSRRKLQTYSWRRSSTFSQVQSASTITRTTLNHLLLSDHQNYGKQKRK